MKMQISIRKIWQLFRGSKATSYSLLMLGPMFIQPLAFVKIPKQSAPLYARLPGLWHTPFLVAGIFAPAFQSTYQWVFWREASKAVPAQTCSELIFRLHETEGKIFWIGFGITTLLLFFIALSRWGYHYLVISFVRKWLPELCNPPLKYFVVTTAAMGFWLSLCFSLAVQGLWYWKLDGDLSFIVNEYISTHLPEAAATAIVIAVCMRLAGRNSDQGMKALYGGRKGLTILVSMLAIASTIAFFWLCLRIWSLIY